MTHKKREPQTPKLRKGEKTLVAEMTRYSLSMVLAVLKGERKNAKIIEAARQVEKNRNQLLETTKQQ